MTFGIDIASPQRDIDVGRAKAEGVEFVIVKMGGLNVTPQYVAPCYRAQIDRVVAAGLPKGHYYLVGKGQTPEQQADYFVANLHRFDPERDVLALDNEALDSNGTRWSDADAARFARRVLALTHIPVSRFWHYAGAVDYRSSVWPELSALGVRFWWAAYGNYPTGHTPDHEPSLQGSIPRWDVHQYSSDVAVAGYALDGNYSPRPVDELFGGGTVPLNNYTLRSPSTVIAADNRDPYVSWQNHLDRTSGLRGGVDIVAAVGTPVYARTSGVMLHIPNDGSAGNSCRFHHDDNPGWKDVFSHLSRYVGASGQHFNAGEIVAYTGDTGGVTQHLHWHLVDPSGVRRNPWDYFAGSNVSGGNTTPIPEDDMYDEAAEIRLKAHITEQTRVWRLVNITSGPQTGYVFAYDDSGTWWHVPNQQYLDLIWGLGLAGRTIQNQPQNVAEFIRDTYAAPAGVVNDSAIIAKIEALSAAEVTKLVAAIEANKPQVVLTQSELAQIVAAAKSGAEAGVKSLEFVTVAQ